MNSPEQWTRIAQLLAVATETPTGHREAWIDSLDDPAEDKDLLRRLVGAWTDAGQQGFLDEPALSRPLSDDRLGTLAGDYTLIRRLGSGGVGEVYIGFHEGAAAQGRPAAAAVKILHRRFVHAKDVLTAFARERELLRGLHHSALVPALDSGITADGLPYLLFDYIEGVPIDVFCNRRRAGLQQRLNLFRQLCEACAYLHERQILHLDVKPSNVLVTAQGEVKLLDLGLARSLSEIPTEGSHFVSPGFSSPEQVCGKPLSVSADIYSLGAVLYVLLTGRPPLELEGLSPGELRGAVAVRRPLRASAAVRSAPVGQRDLLVPVSLSEWERMLRGSLDRLLQQLLHPSPRRREHSAGELTAKILSLQQEGFGRAQHRTNTGMRRLASAALLLFGLVLFAGAAAEGWNGYRSFCEIRALVATQREARAEFQRLQQSPAERQRFVAREAATLERTYRHTVPRLLHNHGAPRRQIAYYAAESMALVAAMAPVARERGDLAAANARLLQTIAEIERSELRNDRAAGWALTSARLLCPSSGSPCAR